MTTLLALALPALAADAAPAPVQWAWPDAQPVRYHVETEILTPRGHRYLATKNLDALAGSVRLKVDAECAAKASGKGWLVSCKLPYTSLTGTSSKPYEQEKFDRILVEWSEMLGTTTVEFFHTKDGKLKEFDTKVPPGRTDARINYIIEAQRILLQRAFCAFDLPLAASGDDWKRGWPQKGDAQLVHLQTTTGTVAASEIKHVHDGTRYGLVVVGTSGRSTVATGGSVDAGSGGTTVDVKLAGEAMFDPANGQLAYRDFTLDGRRTAQANVTGSDVDFYQALALQRVDAFPKPGEAPIPISAQRATQLDRAAPDLPAGVALVPFADLGMQPLFVAGLPESGKTLQLPASSVKARVLVGADGVVKEATALSGYEVLAKPTEEALKSAAFPKREADYAVDLEVEWRP
ncbi:MAG: hypothetical protein ACOZNI_02865 [Myxococcota bacterium]